MENKNTHHTVIVPSYNTLDHLKNTYRSLKEHAPDVDIIIIDDASEDDTAKWLQSLKDTHLTTILSDTRRGHTYWYDEGMRRSKTDIVSILHSDMIIGPNYFENMLKHLHPGKVVCATRIEPPIHPAGKEKLVMDFGDEANNIKWEEFNTFVLSESATNNNKTTKGIFAPWMLYKQDHLSIGGHDQRFTPYGYEDSDIFNRWILSGYEMIQSRDALCYHLTCRGHRWNKGVGIENSDYRETMARCARDFIRKWGDWINNDEYQYPIINPKYNVGIRVENCNLQLLEALEPWCDRIYVDEQFKVIGRSQDYIEMEQQKTSFDLSKRIHTLTGNDRNDYDDVLVEIDGTTFGNEEFRHIQNLSAIIQDSGNIGIFKLDNLNITVNNLETYEKDLIICKK
tara:strand:+ start:15105 stop:16295 length:1191 start_codon:yes stop_codon:yes gene_type:complete